MYLNTSIIPDAETDVVADLPAIDGASFALRLNCLTLVSQSIHTNDPAVAAKFFGDLAVAALHLSEAAQAKLADDALEAEASA